MIKVLINGTPIYRLEFTRRCYRTVNRRAITQHQFFQALVGNVDGGTVQLDHVQATFERLAGGTPLYETTATIHIIDAKKDEPAVATGKTRQRRGDSNSKVVGRGWALKHLLAAQVDGKPVFTDIEKQAIRDAYNNRSKGPKAPTPAGNAGAPPIAQRRKQAPQAKVLEFQRPSLTLAA